ncbi:hypothetical protein RvY_03210 [Ramazzottius varieornatus]|uniref:Gamma-secretase subunit Aph-1 n=1 Tax=Ramazzottius varieornatus TaxID=947166 RepID=A0A1D1UQP9_RAMVA|nr:hypothetical protein RvY_03210 [Ramazzottius varieornatus]
MTALSFFGCALTAFGPSLSFFIIFIARDPIRVIILIASGFFWLVSLLISSGLWRAFIPLQDKLAFGLAVSVVLQELFRFGFYLTMRKAEAGLQMVSHDEMYKDHNIAKARHTLALVSGFGYGLIGGAFTLVNVLADTLGPGTLGLITDNDHYFFFTSAYLTLCFVFLHTFWSVIFFYACDAKKYYLIAAVVLSHLAASSVTLLNSQKLYAASLGTTTVMLIASAIMAFVICNGSLRNWRTALRLKSSPRPLAHVVEDSSIQQINTLST